MKLIKKIAVLILASLALYVSTFSLLKKPISLGHFSTHYSNKLAYSKSIDGRRKVVLIGGSNGLYSHSCREIEDLTGLKCVNTSMSAALGLDFMLEKSKEFINKGDIIILALEYEFYSQTKKEIMYMLTGNNYIFQNDPDYLLKLPPEKALASVFSFDFKYIFSSVVEIAGNFIVPNKFLIILNDNGDVINNTSANGRVYEQAIRESVQETPSDRLLNDNEAFYSQKVIADFIGWCKDKKVVVYGSLPTTFNDKKIDGRILRRIKGLYYGNGAKFIELDNDSQYERSCFYDTPYHLNKECQTKHTEKIANYLIMYLPKKT